LGVDFPAQHRRLAGICYVFTLITTNYGLSAME
jgi:hypothetical protein